MEGGIELPADIGLYDGAAAVFRDHERRSPACRERNLTLRNCGEMLAEAWRKGFDGWFVCARIVRTPCPETRGENTGFASPLRTPGSGQKQ
jgi:hypothetical protein